MKPKESPDASFYNGGRKTHWAVVAFAISATCRCAWASSWATS